MKRLLLALALVGCSHSEGRPHNEESVPVSHSVQQNAIPRDLPPAVPPIPPTSRSSGPLLPDAGSSEIIINPSPGQQVPNAPPPQPMPRE